MAEPNPIESSGTNPWEGHTLDREPHTDNPGPARQVTDAMETQSRQYTMAVGTAISAAVATLVSMSAP